MVGRIYSALGSKDALIFFNGLNFNGKKAAATYRALAKLGQSHNGMNQDLIRSHFEKCLQFDSTNPENWLLYAKFEIENGNITRSYEILDKASTILGTNDTIIEAFQAIA